MAKRIYILLYLFSKHKHGASGRNRASEEQSLLNDIIMLEKQQCSGEDNDIIEELNEKRIEI